MLEIREPVFSLEELHQYFQEQPNPMYGAYIIRWYDARRKEARTIRRFMGDDKNGILYIGGSETNRGGMAARLKVRDQDFQTIDKYTGWFQALHAPASLRGEALSSVPSGEIRIELRLRQDRENQEAELLAEYLKKFGEMPPLNRSWPEALKTKVQDAIEEVAGRRH